MACVLLDQAILLCLERAMHSTVQCKQAGSRPDPFPFSIFIHMGDRCLNFYKH